MAARRAAPASGGARGALGGVAVYPGTFDPVTHGHIDMARRASRLFPRLVVAVSRSLEKDTLLDADERARLVRLSLDSEGLSGPGVRVEVFDGLLVDFCRRVGARAAVRGMRAVADFENEFQMSWANARLDPGLETIFLVASERGHFVSSRMVKEIARLGGPVGAFAPPPVAERLARAFPAPGRVAPGGAAAAARPAPRRSPARRGASKGAAPKGAPRRR